MAESIDLMIHYTQVLCLVWSFESAVFMKQKFDLITKYGNIKSKITCFNQTLLDDDQHILFGTPHELSNIVKNKIKRDFIKLICFDDADVTGQYDSVKTSIIKRFEGKSRL